MRVVLFGTGNVATRLGSALREKNTEILQVFGRTEAAAADLARLLGCPFTTSQKEIISDADLYLLAVSDDAIPGLLSGIPVGDRLVVHTAGSVSMEVLAPFARNFGVFYPLQTLSKQKPVDFGNIPICLEANRPENLEKLDALARTISDKVVHIDSEQRAQLHLAAVFACNFVNRFYAIGDALLKEQQLDFDLLKPLIAETAAKALQFAPATVQTGPAVRNNRKVMEKHLKMLAQHPEWQKLYELISQDIFHTPK